MANLTQKEIDELKRLIPIMSDLAVTVDKVTTAVDIDKLGEKADHVDKLIESEKRWRWARDTIFSAAKWIAAVAAMFVAIRAFGSDMVNYLGGNSR